MPEEGDALNAEQLGWLAEWINRGAPFDRPLVDPADRGPWTDRKVRPEAREFWSFRPLAPVEPPRPADPRGWCRNPIDRFVLAAQQRVGLMPTPEADPQTLRRRLALDVTGLPATPAEIAAFVADPTDAAYRRVVDDLLARPAFGERWAQHWLDVARFAESFGYEQDYDRPFAYHYRDFVIRAFDDDLPYDTFLQWQIAGDELAPGNVEALKATGFLAAGAFPTQLTEKEFETARAAELDDMVATCGTAMLGITIGCARCHDHKFDPLPQADYYRLAATFTTTIRSNIDVEVDPERHRAALAAWQQRLDAAEGEEESKRIAAEKPKPETMKVLVAGENLPRIPHHADERGYPHFYKATHFLRRGDVNQKEGVADPGFLQVLVRDPAGSARWQLPPPAGAKSSHRRAALARWITDADHGAGQLAARVIVNRLWQHHFGAGLVATPSDFGRQGDAPSHPELLDWLAGELIRGGWKLKPLHRLMLTSATYRQSSGIDAAKADIDPANRLLWRYNRRRLEAEAIRDTFLAVSGALDARLYGRAGRDESVPRRSLYLEMKRSRLPLFLRTFDAPDFMTGVAKRSNTTTAPQALAIMNGPAVRAWAERFADRIVKDAAELPPLPAGGPAGSGNAGGAVAGDADGDARTIQAAYALALGRSASAAELGDAAGFLHAQRQAYGGGSNPRAARLALADFCQVLMGLNETLHIE
jgi:hypothetical protein